ncbi:unnamed protein product, partial [Mesorhabditis spiculigera]
MSPPNPKKSLSDAQHNKQQKERERRQRIEQGTELLKEKLIEAHEAGIHVNHGRNEIADIYQASANVIALLLQMHKDSLNGLDDIKKMHQEMEKHYKAGFAAGRRSAQKDTEMNAEYAFPERPASAPAPSTSSASQVEVPVAPLAPVVPMASNLSMAAQQFMLQNILQPNHLAGLMSPMMTPTFIPLQYNQLLSPASVFAHYAALAKQNAFTPPGSRSTSPAQKEKSASTATDRKRKAKDEVAE